MTRRFLSGGLLSIAAALWASGAPAGKSGSASAPSTRPVAPRVSRQVRDQIARWVADLGSDSYRVRGRARSSLKKVINRPGVEEVLMRHLGQARDAEARATLGDMLAAYGQPVVMIWRRAWATKVGGGFRLNRRVAGAPSLFLRGSGEFVYDARSPCFAGKMEPLPRHDYRQGRLTPEELWQLKETIAATGATARPAAAVVLHSVTQGGGIEVAFYLRSGGKRRTTVDFWPAKQLGAAKAAALPAGSDVRAAREICEFVKARPARPYSGPVVLFAERILYMPRQEVQKLPEWKLAGVDIRLGMGQAGLEVAKKLLPQVRQALDRRREYRYSKYAAVTVSLIPRLPDAHALYYGAAR